jgi:hypothetical protein
MDNSQEIKQGVRGKGADAKGHYWKAQNEKLPSDPAATLDAWEVTASAWQDHPQLPQKQRVLRLIPFARRALKDNDEGKLKSFFSEIRVNVNNYDSDVWILKKELDELASSKGGALGGSAPKKRQWAMAAAELLVSKDKVGKTRELIFKDLPAVSPYLEIKTGQDDWEVYREGERVIAVNLETEKETSMTKRQFMDSYISKAKNLRSKPR